jgi:hypothetical protein
VIVGAGQSALESAALLHEADCEITVLVRQHEVVWLEPASWRHRFPIGNLLYGKPDVGPAGVSQLVARPNLYRRLPRRVQDRLGPRSVRPAGAAWLPERLRGVEIRCGVEVRRCGGAPGLLRLELSDGSTLEAGHVLLATGYRVDLGKYRFLDPALVAQIDCVGSYPSLTRGFETSVRGLHVVGAPAAFSFGPLMRFVAGSQFAARSLALHAMR